MTDHKNWYKELVKVQFAINSSVREVHNFTTAFINFGRHIPASGEYGDILSIQNVEVYPGNKDKYVEYVSGLKDVYVQVKAKLHNAYVKNSKAYNLRKIDITFNVRAWVWMLNRVLWDDCVKFSVKLAP